MKTQLALMHLKINSPQSNMAASSIQALKDICSKLQSFRAPYPTCNL